MENESRQTQLLYDSAAGPYLKKWENVFKNRYANASTYFRQKLFERTFSLLKPKPGESVLDLGCGTSTALSQLLDRNVRLYGLDVSLNMLKAGRNFHGLSDRARYVQADALHLPFLSSTFDKILSIEVETYIKQRKQFFTNVYKLLRPGGTSILTVTNLLSIDLFSVLYSLRRSLGRIRQDEYQRFFHVRGQLVRQLRDLQLDFEIESFGWRVPFFNHPFKRSDNVSVFDSYENFEALVKCLPGSSYVSNVFIVSLHKAPHEL